MLETFTLKQHLDTTRQELAQALYQHDAACRVIARLMQERDEARQQLLSLGHQVVSNGSSAGQNEQMVVEEASSGAAQNGSADLSNSEKETVGQLNSRVVEELVSTCAELSAGRKARKGTAASAAPTREAVKGLTVQATHTPHKADAKSAISCLAVHGDFPVGEVAAPPSATKAGSKRGKSAAAGAEQASEGEATRGAVVLTGGTDKNVLLTQQDSGRVLAKITGHHKKVSAVAFHGSSSTNLFSGSADTTVKVNLLCSVDAGICLRR